MVTFFPVRFLCVLAESVWASERQRDSLHQLKVRRPAGSCESSHTLMYHEILFYSAHIATLPSSVSGNLMAELFSLKGK